MIKIKSKHLVLLGSSVGPRCIVQRNREQVVERVDLYPGTDGRAQLGVTWEDESFTIHDWPSLDICAAWVNAQPAFKDKIRTHYGKGGGGSPGTSPVPNFSAVSGTITSMYVSEVKP